MLLGEIGPGLRSAYPGICCYAALRDVGSGLVIVEDANKYEISGRHTSLDLHPSPLSEAEASSLANYVCMEGFRRRRLHESWSARVFLVSGTIATKCGIASAAP